MKPLYLIFLLLAALIACQPNTKRKTHDTQMSTPEITPTQIARKESSVAYCKDHHIPTIDHLPFTERDDEVTLRSKNEIIQRALALCYIGLKSEGADPQDLAELDEDFEILPYLTEEEQAFVLNPTPSQEDITHASWRYESLHVLLWALGHVDSLSLPDKECNVAEDLRTIFDQDREEFTASSTVRSKAEILNQADLIYRIHWACVDARLKNSPAPGGLHPGIVYERHYALNWLVRYMDQEWDDVSTDT